MENLSLKEIVDLGATGLQIVGLWLLWNRLNLLTDRMFAYLENARQERHALRNQVQGLSLEQDKRKRGIDNEAGENGV